MRIMWRFVKVPGNREILVNFAHVAKVERIGEMKVLISFAGSDNATEVLATIGDVSAWVSAR